jgi:hypothetical protein
MEHPNLQHPESTKYHPAAKVCLVLSLLLAAGMLMLLLFFQHGKDQGVFAVVGRTILEGGAPYKEAWDIKTPGIFFIYAGARLLFGASQHAVRILEVLNLLALTWAFVIYSRRYFTGLWPGVFAGCLAVINHVQMGFWDTAQPESFGATALAWALVFATYQSNNDRKYSQLKQALSWALSGLLFTAAALLKPPLGGSIIVSMVVVSVIKARSTVSGDKLKQVLAVIVSFSSGALVLLISVFLYFALRGALNEVYETFFVYIPGHVGLTFSFQRAPILLCVVVKHWFFRFSLFTSVGMVFCFLLPRCHVRELEGYAHLFGVIFFQIIGILIQSKFFPYHYGVILPMTALLGAWGYTKLWNKVKQKWLLLAVFLLAVSWQLYEKDIFRHAILQMQGVVNYDRRDSINDILYTIHDQNANANRKVSEWLSQNTPPGSPVFIWGFESVIYDLADRPSSSRYIYNLPQRASWENTAARQILISELMSFPPSAVVVIHNDPLPKVTGNERDSAAELENFTELLNFIEDGYVYVKSFEDLDIYKNKNL